MIREAKLEDKKEIERLGKCLHENFERLFNVEKMLSEEYNKIYVAQENDEIIGFLMAIVLYENCEILNIVVEEKYRKQKVASSLLDTLISEFADTVSIITLEVAIDNESAIGLYKKFGFEIINKRNNYYGNKDAYLMGVHYERS